MHTKLMRNKSYYTSDISSLKAYNVQTGDIVFVRNTNELYVANKNKEYVKIQSNELSNHGDRPTNCKNCGAVLTSYKCEYCGTEY